MSGTFTQVQSLQATVEENGTPFTNMTSWATNIRQLFTVPNTLAYCVPQL
jgi:hypothetical protein